MQTLLCGINVRVRLKRREKVGILKIILVRASEALKTRSWL